MDRRDFLKGSLAGAGAVAGLSAGGLRAMAEDAAKPDERPKPGVEGGRISFLHPKSTQGAMVELSDKKEFEEK